MRTTVFWDHEFGESFRSGNTRVLETVYLTHFGEVLRQARGFLARYGQASEASDIVQEVFSRAFAPRARQAFDPSRGFGPYLAALTRNLLVDWARKRRREMLDDPAAFEPDAIATALAIEPADTGTISLSDASHIVGRHVSELAPLLREIHELRYVAGRTQLEVCATLGITRQQLRTRERHLLGELRRQLEATSQPAGTVRKKSHPSVQP